MKRFFAAAFALGLVAAAGPASSQTGDRSFEATYTVIARGVEAGDFVFRFNQTGSTYTASATRQMRGLAAAALGRNQDYRYNVSGAVTADGALRPSAYEHQGGRRRDDRPNGRLVRSTFTADNVTTVSVPAGMNMGDPQATAEQRRNVIDQITAIAAMVTTTGDPCSRTLRVYMDGRARFDFAMTPNGNVTIRSRAYEGAGVRCSVAFRPIAGFTDPQEAATLTFLFARTPSGMWAPITIEMPTDSVGIVRLEARRVSANGQALR